jgi:midasin (ATPase involved in ribosome maturation)
VSFANGTAEDNTSFRFQAKEKSFAHTAQVLRTMEAVAVAISQEESTLLVGETGTGKSTLVQHIADRVGQTPVILPITARAGMERSRNHAPGLEVGG